MPKLLMFQELQGEFHGNPHEITMKCSFSPENPAFSRPYGCSPLRPAAATLRTSSATVRPWDGDGGKRRGAGRWNCKGSCGESGWRRCKNMGKNYPISQLFGISGYLMTQLFGISAYLMTQLFGISGYLMTQLFGISAYLMTQLFGISGYLMTQLFGISAYLMTQLFGISGYLMTQLFGISAYLMTQLFGISGYLMTQLFGISGYLMINHQVIYVIWNHHMCMEVISNIPEAHP